MKKESLSMKIQNDILADIAQNRWKPGQKLPTEFELMEQYGVSRITVSNALGSLAKQDIIVRYPRRGSFVSTPSLQQPADPPQEAVKETDHYTIGFIIPSIQDLFALNIISGIASCFSDDSRFQLHITCSSSQDNEESAIVEMLNNKIDGLLLFPVDQEIYNNKILEMKLDDFPLVLVDRYLPGIETHYVISDNIQGGKLAASHLCGLGHKKILVCCGAEADTFSVKERIQGCRNELLNRDIPFHEEDVIPNILNRFANDATRGQITSQLLNPEFTGILATNSAAALFLYDFYKQHGIRIPEDKSLISYDSPVVDLFDFNPFTHLNQDEFTMGREAGLIMKDLLTHPDSFTSYVHKVVPPKLMVRKTTLEVPG